MGHGIRSALGTAIIRAMVEQISPREKDPGRYLQHMNQMLMPILRQDEQFVFATAVYMVVDVTNGTVRYANAGHPVPMHLNSRTGRAEWFAEDGSSAGPALAVSEDAEYRTMERQLAPGDGVVMFTDGIYEVASVGQEEFGEERLLEAAQQSTDSPLEELFPTLLNAARQFAAEGTFDDDVCLVGFRMADASGV